ncbi:MAG: hypothetical protein JSW65_03790 [Candidatus Bipolaricaulota bacterium]|nr:MAG: hypothetical protein JSW65_03790 [Candidatus Bipolaricaulota bacterium]
MTQYEIELEIHEGKGAQLGPDVPRPDLAKEGICAWMCGWGEKPGYQVGDTFRYPQDLGRLCPWLLDSLTGVIRALEHGGTLPWRYAGTPYEKEIDPEGVTTEFVRCIDPTDSGIVIKVTRTAQPE